MNINKLYTAIVNERGIHCKDAAQIMSDMSERHISLKKRLLLLLHLSICAACTNYKKQLKILREIFTLYRKNENISTPSSTNARLSTEARQRIKDLLRKQYKK